MNDSIQSLPSFFLCLALLHPFQQAPAHAPATAAQDAAAVRPPLLSAEKPRDYSGLHNVVAYAEKLYSGSVPEGEKGFASLQKMGVRTVISVDGAEPEVELARRYGLRYVHLPIGYDGVEAKRALELSRAVNELEGPIYLHCHHGKHRSAGAAGAVAVTLGLSTNEEALGRMKVSGTAANYEGLFASVKDARKATPEELASASNEFPEVSKTSGMVQTMVVVDFAHDNLKEIEEAGWKAPADHPDLVPAAEAGKLADALRNLMDDADSKAEGAEFLRLLLASSKAVESLEQGIVANAGAEELSKRFKAVAASCKDCHAKYRD